MWKQGRLYALTLTWIGCVHNSVAAVVSPCSGGVALLGTDYSIQADRSRYTGFVWVRPDGRYVVLCNPGCSAVAGYSGVVNVTHATLTIESVGMADAGTWSISDAATVDGMPVPVCQLTIVTPVVTMNPTDFYCTSHTESSLDLQWVHPGNTLYSHVFVLNYRLMDDKDGIDDRNITIPADKSETTHTTTLKELQPGSLYYFRLVVDRGSLGQSEAVTTTCFTRRSEVSESSGTSMGAGVAIGIAVTLAALVVCLGVAYVFRRKVSAICSGKDSADKDRTNNGRFSEASQERTSSDNNQSEEVPVPQNPYDDLQPRPSTEAPNTYEQLRQYN